MIIDNNLLRVASFFPELLPGQSAWLGHIPFAAWIMGVVQPKIFVELGTHFGHSYFSFCQAAKDLDMATQCYAVDTWKGDEHSGFYGSSVLDFVRTYNSEHYAKFSHLMLMTFDEAVSNFADNSIELLHIDGLHTYEAVRHDFETWLPKLAPGAVVLFHDTNVHEHNFGVWKLWAELRESYSCIEFLHSSGLGVLQLNNAPPEKNMSWLKKESREIEDFISYFGALGLHQQIRYELRTLKLKLEANSSYNRSQAMMQILLTGSIQKLGNFLEEATEMNRIAFYAFFEKKGIVRKHVIYYLKGLQKIASKVVVIVNGELSDNGREILDQLGVEIIVRENIGMDFWAWKTGMEAQGDQLQCYDEIVLSNCSCYGPIYPFDEMFAKMANVNCDFWGITDWPKDQGGYRGTWIMSYFMVFRKNILSSDDWQTYWENLTPIQSRKECIELHETKFTGWFADKGYRYAVYCKNTSDNLDITIEAPDELIINQNCPLIKRKAFCVEYNRLISYSRGSATLKAFEYLQKNNLYDVNMILEDLLATQHYADVKDCLHLNYFLPADHVTHPKNTRRRIALCFHMYYEELLGNSFEYLLSMPEHADLYITTSKPELLSIIKEKCHAYGLERAFIKVIKSRGRSESAFLVACRDFIHDYDYVCVVHDKRSAFLKPGIIGLEFGLHNLDSLLKTRSYVDNIINFFEDNQKIGMLVPVNLIYSYFREFYGNEWGSGNYEQVVALLDELGVDVPIDFSVPPIMPAGAMFWFRPICLKKLFDKQWEYEDFPAEPLPLDGSFNHALERAYPFFVQDSGYLVGWVSSITDAQVHLTNVSYLYRNCKIQEKKILASPLNGGNLINPGVKKALKEYIKRKIPGKLLPYAKKILIR